MLVVSIDTGMILLALSVFFKVLQTGLKATGHVNTVTVPAWLTCGMYEV